MDTLLSNREDPFLPVPQACLERGEASPLMRLRSLRRPQKVSMNAKIPARADRWVQPGFQGVITPVRRNIGGTGLVGRHY